LELVSPLAVTCASGYSRPFKSLGAVSYSPSIVTMAVAAAIMEIFSVKEWSDLKTWLGFIQGHWKWHHLIDCIDCILIQYQRVTDGQTDGRTSSLYLLRASA